ncbi:MAG: hypothetical protein ACJ74J_05510 [Blastocatellia bacterium]
MTTYELLMLLSSIVTAIGGVGFVIVMVQTYKGQMNAQVFNDCNSRYDAILAAFPESAWGARFELDTSLPEPSMELTLCVLRYLNLSSEEFYLYQRGYLRNDVWRVWEAELLRTLRSPLLRREWQTLRSEFVSFPEFSTYVEEAQRAEVKRNAPYTLNERAIGR